MKSFGCQGVQFIAEGAETDVVPGWFASPICIEKAYHFQIVSQPPLSWPLNRELQDFGGSVTVEVSALNVGESRAPHFLERKGRTKAKELLDNLDLLALVLQSIVFDDI